MSKADIAHLVAQAILKLWQSYSHFTSPNAGVTGISPCVWKLSPFNRCFNEPMYSHRDPPSIQYAFKFLEDSYCVEAQRLTCSFANTACDASVYMVTIYNREGKQNFGFFLFPS